MSNAALDLFGSIRIIESVYAVGKGAPVTVPRSWTERWLSWPWRPWITTRTYTPMVPASYLFDSHTLIAHPQVAAQLRELSK